MISNVHLQLLLLILLVLLLFGCKPTSLTYLHQETQPSSSVESIVFLSFSIQKDTAASVILLIEKNIVTGSLKSAPEDSPAPDRLIISQLTSENKEINSSSIAHPLRKQVEFVNENQLFESKLVEQDHAEFFVRLGLTKESSYIRIDEIWGNEKIGSTRVELK